MKLSNYEMARVVRSSWLDLTGRRLDAGPYMSGALEARELLARRAGATEPLASLTHGYEGGIYNGPQFRRRYVQSHVFGVPFLTSGNMMRADLSGLPLLSKKDASSPRLSHLQLVPGSTLISCSGTVGRLTYTRPDMLAAWGSQDVLKVVPDPSKVRPGYVHAFLASKYGVPMVAAGTYGGVIQHLEPVHICNIPVPRLDRDLEESVHAGVEEAARLLAFYQAEVEAATGDFFQAVGQQDITSIQWHEMGPDVGFCISEPFRATLRALNFNPRFLWLQERIQRGAYRDLESICVKGSLARGSRFKRVDAEQEHASTMIGQKELFWLKPEGRLVARSAIPTDAILEAGTIAVAARGTLGESELYCRAEFIWGPWTRFAYSEDILRICTDDSIMRRGCMFAFMRSQTAFRMLRSISMGTKLQDHHPLLLSRLPIPYPNSAAQGEIHDRVISAYNSRHRAVALMDEAVNIVENAIEAGG